MIKHKLEINNNSRIILDELSSVLLVDNTQLILSDLYKKCRRNSLSVSSNMLLNFLKVNNP